jgi:hypothetical protein
MRNKRVFATYLLLVSVIAWYCADMTMDFMLVLRDYTLFGYHLQQVTLHLLAECVAVYYSYLLWERGITCDKSDSSLWG